MNQMTNKKNLQIGDVVDIHGLITTVTGIEKKPHGRIVICTPFGSYDSSMVKKWNEHFDFGK